MASTISTIQRGNEAASSPAYSNGTNLITRRISLLRYVLLGLVCLGFGLQMIQAPTMENATASLLAAAGSILVCIDACRYSRFMFYPLSTLVLLGFGVVLNLVPLLLTAIEGKQIIFNLNIPDYTFLHIFIITVTAIASHAAYRRLLPLSSLRFATQRLLARLYAFHPLSYREVILFTAIGCISELFTRDVLGGGAEVGQSPLIKFIQGFDFLIVAPAAYYIQSLWANSGISRRTSGASLISLVVPVALILLTAIVGNRRSAFLAPLSTMFFGLILATLYGLFRIKLSKLFALGLALFFLLPLASDLTSAMRMTRAMGYASHKGSSASPQEVFDQTLENFSDKESLRRFQQSVNENYQTSALWDMAYYDNELPSRLANIKVVDQSLELHRETDTAGRKEMLRHHINQFISLLPTPIFTAIGLPAELKRETIGLSWGDKQLDVAVGHPVWTSFRVSHFSGTGMSAFGYTYILLLFGGLLVVFTFCDAHAICSSSTAYPVPPVFSIIGFASILAWFVLSGITATLNAFYQFPLRSYWEPIILLFMLRFITLRGFFWKL